MAFEQKDKRQKANYYFQGKPAHSASIVTLTVVV
jgi:hypothetical protein